MLTFGLELEAAACGKHAVVFLPRSTRDIPNYSVWNICLDVTILEETSATSGDESRAGNGILTAFRSSPESSGVCTCAHCNQLLVDRIIRRERIDMTFKLK